VTCALFGSEDLVELFHGAPDPLPPRSD
jgi:hypothetical protein